MWVHLLVHKSDSFQAIEDFVKKAKTQFGKAVKVNALEFQDENRNKFFSDLGIIHQISCVGRPQQNGRVERKHRNILEMSRVLRFQAGPPLKFWLDCVLAATYLTNRLPTHLLGYKTPYEVLFKTKPDYNNLRVFGCLAMASNPSRTADKFSARSIPCLMLGYAKNKRGS